MQDFTCASCGSGFIEETTPGMGGVGHMEDMDDGGGGGAAAAGFMMMPDDMFGGGGGNPFLEQIFGAMGGAGGGRGGMPGGIVIHGSTRPRPQPNQGTAASSQF